MKVLSLFDGISSGRLALERAGIPVEKYYASEIDKYAIQVAQKNYPDTIQIGDCTKIDYKTYAGQIDLLIGGSPCQGFSFAGKQLNFADPRSRLFFEFVRALKEISPKYFLFENVKMKKEFQDIISQQLGVEPIEINSALVSAQNRKRLYWTNIPNISQPDDKGILLKDILENSLSFNNKSHCLDANYYKGGSLEHHLEKHNRELVAQPLTKRSLNNLRTPSEKANCLLSTSWKGAQANGMTNIPVRVAEPVGQPNRIYSVRNKHVTAGREGETRYQVNLPDGDYIIRKLTPVECARLQTMPDHWCDGISPTQQYKCLGNGWTVDVIAHILKQMPTDEQA